MKKTQQKGFSLAEVMIAMLAISIALAAAIPTITKRNVGSDNIWRAGTTTEGAEVVSDPKTISFTGPNILIGTTRLPFSKNMSQYFDENPNDFKDDFSPKSDKLIIFRTLNNGESPFKSSQIGFYNFGGDNSEYAGRLASDKTNLALGIGSLQSLVPSSGDVGKYNTAIGHYALAMNQRGSYNIAFGSNALRGNENSTNITGNVALGFEALANIQGNNNIGIGTLAGKDLTGSNNISLGYRSGHGVTGSNNLLITTTDFNYPYNQVLNLQNILRSGRNAEQFPIVDNDDNFVIGLLSNSRPPILHGFTKTKSGSGDGCIEGVCHSKGLIINTDEFNLNFVDGENNKHPIFTVRNNVQLPLFNTTTRPCGGAPICLSQFPVRSATFYTTIERTGIAGNEYNRKGMISRLYGPNLGSTFTSAVDEEGNITYTYTGDALIPQGNPTFDLYIGSKFENDAAFQAENNINAVVNSRTKNETTGFYEYDPPGAGNTQRLIDVGQRRNNSGLNYDYNNVENTFTSITTSLDSADQHYSLQIRTVKTAVNFLDEFKEDSNWFDNIRNRTDDFLQCLFSGAFTTTPFGPDAYKACTDTTSNNPDKTFYKTMIGALMCKGHEPGSSKPWGICDNTSGICRSFLSPLILTCASGDYNDAKAYDEVKNLDDSDWKCTIFGVGADCNTRKLDCKTIRCTYFPRLYARRCGHCSTESDARLKNISGDNTAGLKEINKLNVVNYTYKADKAKTPHVGVIAQELKTVFPNAVKKGSDGYYRIRLEDMFYAMVNAVKELSNRKDELNTLTTDYIDAPLSELQKQNEEIKAQNELLKKKNAEIEKRLSQLEVK